MNMEVILREDIEKLGTRGEMVKVAAGYARNFLLPKRLAVAATDSNRKIVAQEKDAHLRRDAKLKSEAEELGKLIAKVPIVIARKSGENDHLFGSVTTADIADALAVGKFNVDRKKIELAEPIKTLGEHKVSLRLHKEVVVELTVNVIKED